MKPPFPWSGGKSLASESLINMFPSGCDCYVEPFMGAASVFWNLPQGSFNRYVLNDISDDLVNLFKMIRDRSEDMQKIYKWMLHSRSTFAEMLKVRSGEQRTGHDRELERAVAYFYLLKVSYNGFPQTPGNFRGGANIASLFNQDFDLEDYRQKLKGAIIEKLDFFELLERYDQENVFIFADPPYVALGDQLYDHPFTELDHLRLAEKLRDSKAKWLVTYNDHPLVRELYVGENVRIHKAEWVYSSTGGGNGESRRGEELVIANYDVAEATSLFASRKTI